MHPTITHLMIMILTVITQQQSIFFLNRDIAVVMFSSLDVERKKSFTEIII